MDTFDCYCRNKSGHDNHKQSGCHYVTALHHHAWAVGLSYNGSRMIHSRIANADIQAFRIIRKNGEGRDYYQQRSVALIYHFLIGGCEKIPWVEKIITAYAKREPLHFPCNP